MTQGMLCNLRKLRVLSKPIVLLHIALIACRRVIGNLLFMIGLNPTKLGVNHAINPAIKHHTSH